MNKLHKRPSLENPLRAAIREMVKREMLREQEDKDAPPPEPAEPSAPEPEAPSSDTDTADTGAAEAGPESGGDASGAGDPSLGAEGSVDGAGGPEGGDMDGLGDSMDDSGGGGMGGGGGFAGGMGGGMGGGGGGGGGGGMDSGDSDEGEEKSSGITPPGEPEKNPEDPVGAAVEEAEKIAGQTTDAQKILNALKASIQVNFSDYRQAWPVVERLKQTENKTLQAVASRLALFIADVLNEEKLMTENSDKISITEGLGMKLLQTLGLAGETYANGGVTVFPRKKESAESIIAVFRRHGYRIAEQGRSGGGTGYPYITFSIDRKKRAAMKISQTELKEMIKRVINQKKLSEASSTNGKPSGGTVKINKEELRKMIREAVKQKLLSEDAGYVEHERMRQEVNMLALEFLEKLTQKLNIDLATLSPEALETFKRTHKILEGSVRTAAAELFQLGAVLKAAQGPETNS